MKYEVDIYDDKNDEFEKNADNVGMVEVFDIEGNRIQSQAKVQLYLSKNALLGLGTELIRLAHNYKEGKHFHITPAEKDMLCQRMGIFLTPESNELIVCCSDYNRIDDYLK